MRNADPVVELPMMCSSDTSSSIPIMIRFITGCLGGSTISRNGFVGCVWPQNDCPGKPRKCYLHSSSTVFPMGCACGHGKPSMGDMTHLKPVARSRVMRGIGDRCVVEHSAAG